jgi:uncharacterized membrane protein YGL010W
VFGDRPVRDELKLPVPVPSFVLVLAETVGFGLFDQTTPFEVALAPQSALIVPPLFAVVEVISTMGFVVNVGIAEVVTLISLPYPVPTSLVANARM